VVFQLETLLTRHHPPSPVNQNYPTDFLMESNRDEALRCLHISQKHRVAGNLPSARKFVQKSLALFSTPEAVKLLELIDSSSSSSASSAGSSSSSTSSTTNPTSFTSATETHTSASGAKHRNAPSAAESASKKEKREYTAENLAVVKRVRACKVTEYYEILEVKRECDEADVKKAYRKVSLSVI
jgi:DnaJ family protein B protein 12